MDRPPASAVSAFFCVPRVSAVSAANSSKAADIDLDRKVLADLAVSDEKAFDAIFAQAKKAIEAKDGAALRA